MARSLAARRSKYHESLEHYHQALDQLVPVRPDSFYAVSKCCGEALGRFYADHRHLRVICLRIGSVTPEDSAGGPSIATTNTWLPTTELR